MTFDVLRVIVKGKLIMTVMMMVMMMEEEEEKEEERDQSSPHFTSLAGIIELNRVIPYRTQRPPWRIFNFRSIHDRGNSNNGRSNRHKYGLPLAVHSQTGHF